MSHLSGELRVSLTPPDPGNEYQGGIEKSYVHLVGWNQVDTVLLLHVNNAMTTVRAKHRLSGLTTTDELKERCCPQP